MSKNTGKIFEEDFKKSIPDYCLVIRLNDPPQSFKRTARFSIANPCDYIIWDSKHKLFLPTELKSTKSRSIPYSMIRQNQIDSLTKFAEYDNVAPGFVFNYRDSENNTQRCYFQHIKDFNRMIENIQKKSFNEKDLVEYCAISVSGEKKRTRFRWDIGKMFDDICYNA